MNIKYRDVENDYNDLSEYLQNQLDILEELQQAINDFTGLEDFNGQAATNIKAYYNDLHGNVIKTLMTLIYDIDVTMHYSNNDFEDSVDSGYTPILDNEYIGEKITKEIALKDSFQAAEASLLNILSSVSDIFSADVSFVTDTILTMYQENIDQAQDTKDEFETFGTKHIPDMKDVNDTITKLNTAIDYMKSFGDVSSISIYEPGSATYKDWMSDLINYQISVGEKFEKNGWETTTEFLETYSDYRTIEVMIKNGLVTGVNSEELRKLYMAGVQFNVVEQGERVYFKMVTNITDPAELNRILKSLGTSSFREDKIRKLLGDGLQIVDVNGNVCNKQMLNRLLKSDIISDVLGDVKPVKEYKGGGSKVLGIAGKLFDIADVAITTYGDINDNFYNETTGQWEVNEGKDFVDFATDEAIDLSISLGIPAAGAAIGTAICPGIGTAIGAGVGALIDVGMNWEFGEPPKSIADHISDGVKDFTDSVGNWLSTTFW